MAAGTIETTTNYYIDDDDCSVYQTDQNVQKKIYIYKYMLEIIMKY